MNNKIADVLIIGAGASGGVVARRLALAGMKVVCLEQGGWPDRNLYRGAYDDWELTARKQWSADPNIRKLDSDYPINAANSDIVPLMFNGVGGSMGLFAGTWPRMLPSDFRVRSLDGVADDWPLSYSELQPYYDTVDKEFGISGLSGDTFFPDQVEYPLPPLPIGKAGRLVANGHNKLGWHWWVEPNAILSRPYKGRNQCVQRGVCTSGCGEGAKASSDLTHFPDAISAGAEVITGARVREITTNSQGLVTGAIWIDKERKEHHQAAKIVVMAANAVGTARLLLLSKSSRFTEGLSNSSGLVGRRLMMHTFSAVTGYFPESLGSWQGHFGASITSYEFYETDKSRGFVRGAKWALSPVGGPLGHVLPQRAGKAVWGSAHHKYIDEHFGKGATWAIFGEDLPDNENRVELDNNLKDDFGIPAPRVTYKLSSNSKLIAQFNADKAEESLLASGASHVTKDVLLPYSGWHLMGTARMGDDPQTSVLDRFSRSHDVANLFIVDGSQFVTSSGVNPTSTITALALRAAENIIKIRSTIPVPI
jgi:choline dehydrogenase-like flavoprotein